MNYLRKKFEFSNHEISNARFQKVYSCGYMGAPDEYDNEAPYLEGRMDVLFSFDTKEETLIGKVDSGKFTVNCTTLEPVSVDPYGIDPPEFGEAAADYDFKDFTIELKHTLTGGEEIVIESMDIDFEEMTIKIEIV